MQEKNVEDEFTYKISSISTGHAIIYLDSKKENMITVYEGANSYFETIEVNLVKFLSQNALLNKVFTIEDWVSKNKNIEFLKHFHKLGFDTYADISWSEVITDSSIRKVLNFVNPNFGEFYEMIKNAGFSPPNDKDLEEHELEKEDFENFNQFLIDQMGNEDWECEFVVKLGSKGSIWFAPDGYVHEPCLKSLEVVDTTGAGDCYFAALIFKSQCYKLESLNYTKTSDLKSELLKFCNAAALISCSRKGAQEGPTCKEVNKILND